MNTRTREQAKRANPIGYCQARTRKQVESPYWGDSHIGCSRYGVIEVHPGLWACKQHAHPDKRYGWN